MSVRPRIKKHQTHVPRPTAQAYQLRPTEPSSATNKRLKQREEPRLVLPNGIVLTQNIALPRVPGQVGIQGDRPVDLENVAFAAEEHEMAMGPVTEGHVDIADFPSPSKHRTKRLKQWQTWTTAILPMAIAPYLELLRRTRSMRNEVTINVDGEQCACCLRKRKLMIWVIRFSSVSLLYRILLCGTNIDLYYRNRAD